jgi:hypothetical protein
MRTTRAALVAIVAVVWMGLSATPAFADLTGFIGATTTPENRAVKGVAIGTGLLIVGVEFEYAVTPDDLPTGSPSLKTGSVNGLLQTPSAIFGFQPYVTGGLGIYNETLGTNGQTGLAPNTGAGVKINLVGPLRLRVDYRVFRLGSGALYSPVQRFYAGVNVKF